LTANEFYVSCFKGLEALDTLGVVNRIAYYFGDGGTGTDFHDGANPTTGNAFSVWEVPPAGSRTWSWYFMLQYSQSSPFGGAANGAPARLSGSTTGTNMNLGFQAAVAFTSGGASANPWTAAGGTTNNDGTDSKADPVWAPPASGSLQVYPKNNNTGESYAASKENCTAIMSLNANYVTRLHMIMDSDNIAFTVDHDDDNEYESNLLCGWYTPLSGLTPKGPLFLLKASAAFAPQAAYTGSDGGLLGPLDESIRSLIFDIRDYDRSTTYQPNNQFGSPEYMEAPLALYVQDANQGLVGFADPDFCRYTYNIVTNSTIDSLGRVVIGGTSTAASHFTLPWDGATTDPGNPATTRVGIDF
jgi:hypothetical protein